MEPWRSCSETLREAPQRSEVRAVQHQIASNEAGARDRASPVRSVLERLKINGVGGIDRERGVSVLVVSLARSAQPPVGDSASWCRRRICTMEILRTRSSAAGILQPYVPSWSLVHQCGCRAACRLHRGHRLPGTQVLLARSASEPREAPPRPKLVCRPPAERPRSGARWDCGHAVVPAPPAVVPAVLHTLPARRICLLVYERSVAVADQSDRNLGRSGPCILRLLQLAPEGTLGCERHDIFGSQPASPERFSLRWA